MVVVVLVGVAVLTRCRCGNIAIFEGKGTAQGVPLFGVNRARIVRRPVCTAIPAKANDAW